MENGTDTEMTYTPDQIDALREIGNIGASHASTALTTLLNQDILVDVPECFICKTLEAPYVLGDAEQTVVAVYLDAYGRGKGSMLLILSEDIARKMTDMLLWREHDPARAISEDDNDAISEIGNICGSAYLNAISNLLGVTMLPSPPGFAVGMLGAVLEYPTTMASEEYDYLVIIKTHFITDKQRFPGYFIYIPDRETERLLMDRFGLP
ncbi:MAG TPA: chemotaxis protein CheC [Methanomassiliicoccales archaeon]|jgi:chemotaxis protein CheC